MRSDNIMRALNYSVVDVFTGEKYKGNPLSVVELEEDLEFFEMVNIAREFGYAETSFVSYAPDENTYKVRSLTPAGVEVNGAGHNLLGAVCLALLKGRDIFSGQQGGTYVFMKDKKIPVGISYLENGRPLVKMQQQPATVLKKIPKEMIAGAIGLDPEDLAINDWEPLVIKTEVAHLMVPVKNSTALNKAKTNKTVLSQLSEQIGFQGCYLFTINPSQPGHIAETRFFNPGIGIDEDAATGSAAGPLAGYLFQHGQILTGKNYTILQGVQMQHPSVIAVEINANGIWISGSSVLVMEGKLYL